MIRRALPPLVIVVALAGIIGLAALGPVAAQTSPTRALPPGSVAPGDRFTVTISNLGLSIGAGQVVETLPSGFSYVDGSAAVTTGGSAAAVEGSETTGVLTFEMVALDAFSYDVMVDANAADGIYRFSGILRTFAGDTDIGGNARVVIDMPTTTTPSPTPSPSPTPTAMPGGPARSLPADDIERGDNVTVNISTLGLATGFGQVLETLPSGVTYVAGSATITSGSPSGTIEGNEVSGVVTFDLVGADAISYDVTVGFSVAAGTHSISGILKTLAGDQTIGGDTDLTVVAPPPAQRALPPSYVDAGDRFMVTISNTGLTAGFGQVVERLPANFDYVGGSVAVTDGSSAASIEGNEAGGVITFDLVGVNSFTYDVSVGTGVADGDYSFSGTLKTLAGDQSIGGDTGVRVGAPPPPTNVAPTAVGSIEAPALMEGGGARSINLTGRFNDADDDPLTYAATTNRRSVVRVSVSGSTLRLVPVSAGTARVTVTATDPDGEQAMHAFTVRVEESRPPTVAPTQVPTGPMPVRTPVPALPPTGDVSAPSWLLLAVVLGGAALTSAGLMRLRRTRRSTRAS